jgi:hypothetical protein
LAFAIAARSAGVKHFFYLPALIRPAPGITSRSITERTKNTKASNGRAGFIRLGCPKAPRDSERILFPLRLYGYDAVPTYKDADIVVVNTCGLLIVKVGSCVPVYQTAFIDQCEEFGLSMAASLETGMV